MSHPVRRSIEDLPGVGPQLATKIRTRFAEDAHFFDAARRQDLQAIAAIDGVSERRAVDLVLAAGDHPPPDRFLATPAARRVHERLMERLLPYASTPVGRNRLRLLHPLPDPEMATRHMQRVMEAKATAGGLDAATVRRHLRRLRPRPSDASVRPSLGMLLVAESDDVLDRLREWGLHRVATLGTPRDLADVDGYDLVVVVYDDGHMDTSLMDHVVEVSIDDGPTGICPDMVLAGFEAARATMESCAALADATGRASVAPTMLRLLDGVSTAHAPDASDLDGVVAEVKEHLDQELSKRVADQSLAGPELLAAVSTGRLPLDLQRIMDGVLDEGRQMLHDRTGIRFQPFIASFPLTIDDDEIARIQEADRSASIMERFHHARDAAKRLQADEDSLWDEVRSWQEFDADFALGCFAMDHDLHPATFADHLRFDGSIHLDMAGDPDAQRIAYHLGDDASVAVLTGANSGGKSTLLEHITQIALMARIGLPVVGQGVQVPWLDEVHLVTARRGLDAGAFESFLRGFLPVTRGDAKRLVLADEVEAVTELDAAGRILAWALRRLTATRSLAVVVTHLAEQVLRYMDDAPVRIDGIEATGLDDQHRLIVDRCPRMGRLARSTPELIIQRLAATARGDDQTLFADLLGAFSP